MFAAELTAMDLAIEMIKRDNIPRSEYIIFADSQPSINAVVKPKKQSGQEIIQRILFKLEGLLLSIPNLNLTIEWIPGYMDIVGNERADEEAKKAARGKGNLGKSYGHRMLKSSRNQAINASIANEAKKEWEKGETKEKFQRIIRSNPKYTGPKYYNQVNSMRQVSWLIRLRTGHIPLNQYLHRFNIIESPKCECGQGVETITHYILQCKRYIEQRSNLRSKVGARGMKLHSLLGDPKNAKVVAEYVESTRRF